MSLLNCNAFYYLMSGKKYLEGQGTYLFNKKVV